MSQDEFTARVKRNVIDNFDQSISVYQAFEEKHGFFSALALKLAETIGLRVGASVLDVGCGTGISARVLHDRFACSVLGVDLCSTMVAAGCSACNVPGICLVVGDGENLAPVVKGRHFDYVLYNASIFIFPDVSRTIDEAFACLHSGGKIAFSFYPELVGENEQDLFEVAFRRLGEPLPRFRVITDYTKVTAALTQRCGNIRHHRWERPLDIEFLQDFFSIPAQSASLFPGRSYETRQELVKRLFATLHDLTDNGRIVWRMAESLKKYCTAVGDPHLPRGGRPVRH
ncbi:MAG: class I SAM-dependent methyltransferase, partial [Desulfobacterales bacterium]